MQRLKVYRRILLLVAIIALIILYNMTVSYFKNEIPDNIVMFVNEDNNLSIDLPLDVSFEEESIGALSVNNERIGEDNLNITIDNDTMIKGNSIGNYSAKLSFFGLLDLKSININVIEQIELLPGGNQIGVYIETDGLMVLGTGVVEGCDSVEYLPANNIVKTGDYILSVNDIEVKYKAQMIELIQSADNDDIRLLIRRNGENFNVVVRRVLCEDNSYKIGVWVRDNMQGIGTMTYIDENDNYGALGHGISDVDTGLLMETNKGSIYPANIIDIKKGMIDEPGELIGIIDNSKNSVIGSLDKNTSFGIYGKVNNYKPLKYNDDDKVKICLKQNIKEGKAYIRCGFDENIDLYEIKISDIRINSMDNKSFMIEITDKRLLEKTNGIVQGMSGSPIMQNGKLVGAVTHVLVNNPTRGYGIFIENMLDAAK